MSPKISLLMASYNNSRYIKQAIESVVNQSSSDWELVIVDDCSVDDSLRVIEQYLKDPRIKLIHHKDNQGYAGALKTAVDNSSGEIIGRIDADDVLDKDAVEIMLQAHKDNEDCGLIYSTFFICDGDLNVQGTAKWVGSLEEGKCNLHSPRVSHFETFTRDCYNQTEGFDVNQKKAVDKDLVYKLEEITSLKFIDKPLYYYRQHGGGISQGVKKGEAYVYDVLARYRSYKRRLKTDMLNLSKKEMFELLKEAGNICREVKESKKARFFFFEAFKLNPTQLGSLVDFLGQFGLIK